MLTIKWGRTVGGNGDEGAPRGPTPPCSTPAPTRLCWRMTVLVKNGQFTKITSSDLSLRRQAIWSPKRLFRFSVSFASKVLQGPEEVRFPFSVGKFHQGRSRSTLRGHT